MSEGNAFIERSSGIFSQVEEINRFFFSNINPLMKNVFMMPYKRGITEHFEKSQPLPNKFLPQTEKP